MHWRLQTIHDQNASAVNQEGGLAAVKNLNKKALDWEVGEIAIGLCATAGVWLVAYHYFDAWGAWAVVLGATVFENGITNAGKRLENGLLHLADAIQNKREG